MRTTVNIDDELLAEAKVIAARGHRTIGSVLEEALREHLERLADRSLGGGPHRLVTFEPEQPGLRTGVDLTDRDRLAEALGDNALESRV